ncbi:hypothetical protein [Saccharopolyspora gregorii]|uniref:Uncharacterized protein n=1 Tax=Saccharopolyspora gregorii TaxID=33914 RepID=A0ABP6S3D2_9PSEU
MPGQVRGPAQQAAFPVGEAEARPPGRGLAGAGDGGGDLLGAVDVELGDQAAIRGSVDRSRGVGSVMVAHSP